MDEAAAGESGALVIRGEAGIGKTALLEYAAGRPTGMMVLRVGGVESESDLAFAGLLGLLRPVLDRFDGLFEMQRRALAGALGLAEASSTDRVLSGIDDHHVRALLARRRQRLLTGGYIGDLQPFGLEQRADRRTRDLVRVDDQDTQRS